MEVRTENLCDRLAVRAINESAFETCVEADLVDALREQAQPIISLVAVSGISVLGHILFSPVFLTGHPEVSIMGLGPMAVVPEFQKRGIGSALVQAGLKQCRMLEFGAVVVLGHPTYYPRFGFASAARSGIGCEYEVPEEAFMVLELEPDYLHGVSGIVKYHEAFGSV